MRSIKEKIKLQQLTNLNCPVCMIDEEHDDLNYSLFFRKRSEKQLLIALSEGGFHFTLEELRTHRKHLRVALPAEEKWDKERRLLQQDVERLKLPSMESVDLMESKIKSVRAVLNELEEAGLRLTPEYNVYVRRLTELVELKEKLRGKLQDRAVTIDLSSLKEVLEKRRKGGSASA